MKLEDFDYQLPKALIAQTPSSPRDHARLLVYRASDGTILDDYFYNLADHLAPNTTLVLNNSKVEKARLRFGSTEIFILETHNDRSVTALVRPGRKFKLGSTVDLAPGVTTLVIEVTPEGHRRLEFSRSLSDQVIKKHRLTPLPPYITQNEGLADEYQTVYAKDLGSKAAPTAGLHFTPELLARIKKDWTVAELTLHVGLGTFAPISDEDVARKKLHAEKVELDEKNAANLNRAEHTTAVGTTTVRSLESLIGRNGKYTPAIIDTDIFIQPGDEVRSTQSLITNFHLPKSSLMMLVAAFIGRDELLRVYSHAVEQRYRFYSFGDAMIIV